MNRYTLMPYITGLSGGAALTLGMIRNPLTMLFVLTCLSSAIYLAVSHREIQNWKRTLTKVAVTVPVGITGLIFFFNPWGLLFGSAAIVLGIWAVQKYWLKEDETILDTVTESEAADKLRTAASVAKPVADVALGEMHGRLDQLLRETQAKSRTSSRSEDDDS